MADLAELKQMVLAFRVSELHVLLGYAGRNKSGRKPELTQRALQLVSKNCSTPVQIKIRELYRQVFPDTKGLATGPHGDMNMPGMHHSQGKVDYNSMRPLISQAPIPVNPDVKLKHLPFYDVLGELMKPSSLIPKSQNRMQETLFVFHLTPQQAQDITLSRDYRPGAKVEYNVQVQLRFCLLETTSEQADTFPSQIQVRVNNKPATLPPKVLPLHNKAAPKPWGGPLDVTTLCKLNPNKDNTIHVTWSDDLPRTFCMAIYLVSKLSSEILLSRLKQFGNRHSDHTKALIKEKLQQDPDSEIATTSLRVSLICPLGKMRMQIPCRASSCPHLQCFDAITFLKMNERKPTWQCPVCDRQCPYEKLIIDGYFVEILRRAPSFTEINFHEDGNWSPVKNQKESSKQVNLSKPKAPSSSSSSSHSAIPSATVNPMMMMSGSSSITPSSACQQAPMSSSNKPAPHLPPMPPASAASFKGPVIDLTLDSSDEDDDDVVIPTSDPIVCHSISPPPVINLDSPSPAANNHSLPPASPTVLLSSSSSSPIPAAAHAHNTPAATASRMPPQSQQQPHHPFVDHTTHSAAPVSVSRVGSGDGHSVVPTGMDSILGPSSNSLAPPPSSSSSSSTLQAQAQALNLEAMSDADFDEFLKGLSWGV